MSGLRAVGRARAVGRPRAAGGRAMRWLGRALVPWGLALASSCASTFDPASELTGVRILGVRSETPYVRPGASFTAEVLAHDARPDRSRPMRLYWLDDVCLSPTDGKPDDCYRQLEARYPRRQDLTPLVTEGAQATFVMPSGAIGASPAGPTLPTALVFVAACAGHLEMVGRAAGYPASVPFACVDDRGRRLGADDSVFAFMRLYVSSDLANANPAPGGVTLDGVALPTDRATVLPRCAASSVDDCPALRLAVTIGDESQEVDPTSGPPGGPFVSEQIWATFFATAGKLESEAVILFDGRNGRTSGSDNEYRVPTAAGDVDLFVVTRDNRSGAAFQSFKLRVE